uniref:Uncharacterized protein n=1 Tax=Arundo donax TaxID=35708 RepID=A0A0A8Z8T3_ARUDO
MLILLDKTGVSLVAYSGHGTITSSFILSIRLK